MSPQNGETGAAPSATPAPASEYRPSDDNADSSSVSTGFAVAPRALPITGHDGSKLTDRAQALTGLLHNAPEPGDLDALREHLTALAAHDVLSLFIYPGTKEPVDGGVRRAARALRHPLGERNARGGVYLATDDPALLSGYLDLHTQALADPPNVAVALYRSRLVVVDADTAEQAAAFRADAGLDEDARPTVRTPGARDHHGTWVHRDGGHWWFVVPEDVELPDRVGWLTAEGGYAVMWGERYVLAPPSVRAEGAYETTGTVGVLPEWLCGRITETGARAQRAAVSVGGSALATSIDEWSAQQAWSEVLPERWKPTGRVDGCGCPTWTAPGVHASPKSATAHEPGCTNEYYRSDNPPLHIWSDNPGEPFESAIAAQGTKTFSKLQVAVLVRETTPGDLMTEHGLFPDTGYEMDFPERATGGEAQTAGKGDPDTDDGMSPMLRAEVERQMTRMQATEIARRAIADRDAEEFELPPVRSLAELLAQDDPEVRFMVDQLIPAGGARIVLAAQEKAGKTTMMGNVVRSMADGDAFLDRFTVNTRSSSIVIIDNEMSESMTRRWLREQGIRNADAVSDVVTLRGQAELFDIGNDRKRAMWARRFADLGCDLLIFDCLRPVLDALGLDENHEAGKFLTPFDALLAEAGCQTAMIVHHMGHSNERARGDSRIVGWPDCLWKIVRDPGDPDFGAKFFSAKVRDAEPVPEGSLSFDPATKHLTYEGGNRAQVNADQAAERAVVAVLRALACAHDAPNTEALVADVGGNRGAARDAVKRAIAGDLVATSRAPGKGGGTLHHLTDAGREALNAAGDPFEIGPGRA